MKRVKIISESSGINIVAAENVDAWLAAGWRVVGDAETPVAISGSLADLKRDELVAIALEHGIAVKSSTTKAALIAAIEAAEAAVVDEDADDETDVADADDESDEA